MTFPPKNSGLTETCGVSTVGFPDDMSLVGTVGVASAYIEVRLEEVPELGYDPLATPSRGEVCLRGKTIFTGYYKNPELTKEVMIDGWFHTGKTPNSFSKFCYFIAILKTSCCLTLSFRGHWGDET